jgi:hypothetical protein
VCSEIAAVHFPVDLNELLCVATVAHVETKY